MLLYIRSFFVINYLFEIKVNCNIKFFFSYRRSEAIASMFDAWYCAFNLLHSINYSWWLVCSGIGRGGLTGLEPPPLFVLHQLQQNLAWITVICLLEFTVVKKALTLANVIKNFYCMHLELNIRYGLIRLSLLTRFYLLVHFPAVLFVHGLCIDL